MLVTQDPLPPPPQQNTFHPMGSFEDFFNFDLLNASAAPSSSRSSSHSPTNSFSNLPPTPALDNFMPMDEPGLADPLFGDFYNLVDESTKRPTFLDTFPPEASPLFDSSIFSSFASSSSGTSDTHTSPESISPSAVSPSMTIDPSLMKQAPAPPAASMPLDDILEESDPEDDEEHLVRPVKVGGKGGARKGTVASGGVRKNSGSGGAVMTQAVRRDTDAKDDDDWRPSPEEYKKMSSKEKRQLRNKISARNFRVRRKEYITTLEGDIADRDSLIDAIRNELGNTKLENQSLRQEVDALKIALLKGGITPDLPPPGPLSPTPPVAASKETKEKKEKGRQALLAKPNTQKDLPSSPRLKNAGGFWGGASAGGFGGFGGATPVHTTLVPELAPLLSDKLSAAKAKPVSPQLQENLNPYLNGNPFYGVGATPTPNPNNNAKQQPFDAFADRTPFTLKNLDLYRMQLWGQVGARRQQPQQQALPASSPTWAPMEGLVGQMRPSFFAQASTNSKPSSTLSAILSGKGSSTNVPATPPSPSSEKKSTLPHPTPQQATVAALVSQTFLGKMSSAFWDAFSVPTSSNWDTEKIRKVLDGSAVVRVVDVAPKRDNIEVLEESMRSLVIGAQGGSTAPGLRERGSAASSVNATALSGKKTVN